MSILTSNPQILYRQLSRRDQHQSWCRGTSSSYQTTSGSFHFDCKKRNWNKITRRNVKAEGFSWPNFSKPTTIEMEPINDSDQLDQILNQAKELSQPVVIDWMASWCRKCIYLKPMMEKLAAELDTKTKFYYVDVNQVSKDLVKRGNITKMPTIQLWKDGEMKEEVIGGHKAWLVVDEVKEMINKFI